MSLYFYAIVSFVVLLSILFSKSRKYQSHISAIHALIYFSITTYILTKSKLPEYHLNNYLFIDHLGIYEILMASLLFFFSAIYSKGHIEGLITLGEMDTKNEKRYYVIFNLLLLAITYTFLTNNLALFWIFAELTTALSAMQIITLNAKKNIGAAIKYVFINATCMLFSFIGLIFLFALSEHTTRIGTLNWNTLMVIASELSPTVLFAAFAFTFIGFAAKSGVAPFHSWLPTTYSKVPAPTAILSGVVTNIGLYGILRIYSIASQTIAISKISYLLISFGLLSIAVATISMLSQKNLKKLIGYSTIEHTGLILIGIGIGTATTIYWILFHILAQSLTKAILFFSAGIIHHQYKSVKLEHIKDVFKMQPLATSGLIIGTFAIIGMPPFAIFLSKLFLLLEVGRISPILLIILLIFFTIAASGYVIFLTKIISSKINTEKNEIMPTQYTSTKSMNYTIIAIIIIITLLGLFIPQQLNNLLLAIVADLGIVR